MSDDAGREALERVLYERAMGFLLSESDLSDADVRNADTYLSALTRELEDMHHHWVPKEAFRKLEREVEELRGERDEALRVLSPSMPESGLVDACRQVKQVAISEADNARVGEARCSQLAEYQAAVREWRSSKEALSEMDASDPDEFPQDYMAALNEAERALLAIDARPVAKDANNWQCPKCEAINSNPPGETHPCWGCGYVPPERHAFEGEDDEG